MKFCVIGPKDSKESLLIKNLAENQGHVCKRVYMPDVYFEVDDSQFHAIHRKIELLDFDVFIFRGITKHEQEAELLAKYLVSQNKVVIDESLTSGVLTPLSVAFKLAKNEIPQLNLYQTNSLKAGRDVLMEIDHPILLRANGQSSKEMSISEDWTDSYDIVRTNKLKHFTFQQYLKAPSYMRIFVIGNEVIGGLQKEIMEDEPKLNHSKWTRNRKLEVTSEVAELAQSASSAVGYEICSVDIVTYENKQYVLGVQRAPNFTVFQKVTGIDFAEKIITYAVQKTTQQ